MPISRTPSAKDDFVFIVIILKENDWRTGTASTHKNRPGAVAWLSLPPGRRQARHRCGRRTAFSAWSWRRPHGHGERLQGVNASGALRLAERAPPRSGGRCRPGASSRSARCGTMTTAVAEATVVADAAAAGDTGRYEAWWAFSEGKAAGFMFPALAVALIAGREATSARAAMPGLGGVDCRRRRSRVLPGLGAGHVVRTHHGQPSVGGLVPGHVRLDAVVRPRSHEVETGLRKAAGLAERYLSAPASTQGATHGA
jgi:hypothetical protein